MTDAALDDDGLARLIAEGRQETSAHVSLTLAELGVFFDRALVEVFPRVTELCVQRPDGDALSPWDLALVARWRFPATLVQLCLAPMEWGSWLSGFDVAHDAAMSIVAQLAAGEVVARLELSALPDHFSTGTYERVARELQRTRCHVFFR